MTQTVTRRLAAILAADMAGYSRLMGVDEEGTLAALRSLRREQIDPKIAAHRGNIIKTTGDGMLVEFPSVVDAMRCAVEVQRAVDQQVRDTPPDRRIAFRIGVNLGDIIFEDGDIYGEGVNLAARLEQLAAPGGICASNMVYSECSGESEGGFSDGGRIELKNIAQPVHVWHWQTNADAGPAVVVAASQPLADKPSIAVLPFVNMSKDQDQEFFADGMTEDINTGLSFDNRLFVIARNSTFAYKGQSPDIRTVGRELGVRYVVEGSIRPMGSRLRITVQLIDTTTGAHVWADKIDRPTAEIFDIMDEVVDGLVTALSSNLGVAEAKRAARARPEDLQAWALCGQAEVAYFSQQPESTATAEKLLLRAAEIEPGYGVSWALLAFLRSSRIAFVVSAHQAWDTEEGITLANKSLRLAPQDPLVLGYCGMAFIWAGQAARAVDCLEHSLEINPNNSLFRLYYGAALWADGRPEAGVIQFELFFRLSPRDHVAGIAYFFYAWCYLSLDNFPQAEQFSRKVVKLMPGFAWGYVQLALSLAGLGHLAAAHQQMQIARQMAPAWTHQSFEVHWRLILRKPEDAEKQIALLRQAWPD